MGFALDPAGFDPASVLALAFATVGAYAGALVGRLLREFDPAR
jgi:Na+/glutamate symporter